ncbi:MAG: outer membrane lipoprotein chaperone LolA [Pseudomonadales bacterium]
MNRQRIRAFSLRWGAVIAFALVVGNANALAATALDQLIARLSQFDQLHLRYFQVTLGDFTEQSAGEFLLKRPAQFKLIPDEGAIVLSDGETLWTQDDLLAQVTAEPLDGVSTFSPARLMLMNLEEMDAAFEVQLVSDDGRSFMLTPKDQRELIQSVRITFDSLSPVQITLVSRASQQVIVDLTVISVNQMIGGDEFTVEIGDGVDFVDYR